MQQVAATCSLVKIHYSNLMVKTCRDLMVLAFSALPFHSFKHEFSFKSTLRKLHVFLVVQPANDIVSTEKSIHCAWYHCLFR